MSSEITINGVHDVLRNVQDPELHKDLVTLGMIRNVVIEAGVVSFDIFLTTPACPLRSKIEADARAAVLSLEGVKEVKIRMDAQVPTDGRDRGLLSLPVKHAVAIASGKGGVGKSTVAVNVAVALAKSGAAVGLLDADIYGPNVPTMMGLKHLPVPKDNKLIPASAYGVKVMSIGFLVKPGQPLIWRGPMLHSAIRQFLTDVEWGALDYLIIDLPPGTGDAQLSLAQSIALSGGVIVTLPQAVSLEDASRGLYMFHELDVPVLGVVENMSYLELPNGSKVEVFGKDGGMMLAKKAGAPFYGMIPMDPAIRKGGDEGIPVVISAPESSTAKALTEIAEKIAASLSVAALQSDSQIQIDMIG